MQNGKLTSYQTQNADFFLSQVKISDISRACLPLKNKLRYRVFIKYCVFLEDLKIFRTLAFLSMSLCVHTPGRQNTSAAAELAEFRKIKKKVKEKTQYLMNTLQLKLDSALSPLKLCHITFAPRDQGQPSVLRPRDDTLPTKTCRHTTLMAHA